MIALVDYGMGNLKSVFNALECVGASVRVTSDPADLREAAGIIIPGVGAFADGISNLQRLNMMPTLREEILGRKKPFLGICLGMQFLAEVGYESGETPGFGFIPGKAVRLNPSDKKRFKVPHVGWNSLQVRQPCPLFEALGSSPVFYFVHSYHFDAHSQYVCAASDHGQEVTAAVWRENIFGVQFHPEKSQGMGLKVLENFSRLVDHQDPDA